MKQMLGIDELHEIYRVKSLHTKQGVLGEWCPDLGIILIDSSLKGDKLDLTILHEFFHIFFRDADDVRRRQIADPKSDPIERRADRSALNMLTWYKNNVLRYNDFKNKFDSLAETITYSSCMEITE
jgi:Zn-dependent peptidase ImmA (M78 family)